MYKIFENLMKEHGVTAYKVSKETGIATSTLSDWKKGRSTPKQDKLQKIADYFNVTMDYLLTGNDTEKKEKDYSLSIKEQENIDDEAKKIVEELTVSFSKNKDSFNEEDYFAIENAIRTTLEAIQIKNKKKFTPKKYR
ncbi:Putative transcriptional regulator [Clostridium neonatale]|uniref:helix-turn-helix domain-containing protein n=1 Tax=Clostridium neonatale TaxID=137838 RepID=UPI001D56D24F|nr:helix-turn-helix transcriptional regulator [Clostridium neonatale]CAG9702676.1 Putative transcriptional regulator [Clostridium neonatale]